jgi:hypothetical protein
VASGRALILALSGCGVLLIGAGGWFVLFLAAHGLQEGKGEIDQASDCRTSLAKTTACHGKDTTFQECHYHYRADGIPDAQVCAAFLAGPRDGSVAEAGSIACPETSPVGWEGVSCEDYGLDPKMACFRCIDHSAPETARALLQGFDRSCEQASCSRAAMNPYRKRASASTPQRGEADSPANGSFGGPGRCRRI